MTVDNKVITSSELSVVVVGAGSSAIGLHMEQSTSTHIVQVGASTQGAPGQPGSGISDIQGVLIAAGSTGVVFTASPRFASVDAKLIFTGTASGGVASQSTSVLSTGGASTDQSIYNIQGDYVSIPAVTSSTYAPGITLSVNNNSAEDIIVTGIVYA